MKNYRVARALAYAFLGALAGHIGSEYWSIRPLLSSPSGPDPLPYPGTIEVFTRHDKIPVASLVMGHDAKRNYRIMRHYWKPGGFFVFGNPNFSIRGWPSAGVMIRFETEDGSRFGLGGSWFSVNDGKEDQGPSTRALIDAISGKSGVVGLTYQMEAGGHWYTVDWEMVRDLVPSQEGNGGAR